MNKLLVAALIASAALLAAVPLAAPARTDVSIVFGAPAAYGYYQAPRAYYRHAPVFYYGPPTVYYRQPSYYGSPFYYNGRHNRDYRGWDHRRDNGWHGRDDHDRDRHDRGEGHGRR